MGNVWILPHTKEKAGSELGIVQFRMNLEARMKGEPMWDRDWEIDFEKLKKGDVVIFAFKEYDEWYAVGDAMVFKIDNAPQDSEFKFRPRYECFRLYPRNVSYTELAQKLGDSFRPTQYKHVKIDAEAYLSLLELTVTEPSM